MNDRFVVFGTLLAGLLVLVSGVLEAFRLGLTTGPSVLIAGALIVIVGSVALGVSRESFRTTRSEDDDLQGGAGRGDR